MEARIFKDEDGTLRYQPWQHEHKEDFFTNCTGAFVDKPIKKMTWRELLTQWDILRGLDRRER